MTAKPDAVVYTAIPTDRNSTASDAPNYVVLPYSPRRQRRPCFPYRRQFLFVLAVVVVVLSVYLLWSSDPDLRVVRVQLNNIRVRSSPTVSIDLSLFLIVRVRNRGLYSLDYDSLTVAIGYRGRELGFVESEGGNVKAKGSSYVNSTLVLDGFEVLHDFFYLIEDVDAGSVPFDSVSTIKRKLGLFFFKIPIQAKVSCEVRINPMNQTVIRHNCYPE